MGRFWSDVRSAAARLRRSPLFAIGATLSLAIGMSLATAVFSVVDSILWQPLPFGEPERLGFVYQTLPRVGWDVGYTTARWLAALRAEATAFTQIAAWAPGTATNGEGESLRRVSAVRVTSNFFTTLRVRPMLGRVFEASDEEPDGGVVISHLLWSTRFGGDSTVVGRELPLRSESSPATGYRVLGVMPPGFDFPRGTEAWLLLSERTLAAESGDRREDIAWYATVGRLAPGVSLGDASVQAAALFGRLYRGDPVRGTRSARVATLREYLMSGVRDQLQLWVAAAILILILCAVNFATMALARGMRRRGELAVRAAIGASRVDLVRGFVVEAMVLALAAGVLALLSACWLMTFATRLFATGSLPVEPSLSWAVIGFGVGATMLIGFVFAAAPAVELAKVDIRSVLQGEAPSTTARSSDVLGRRALVALQLCLALTAVATVTALLQADRRFRRWETDFDYDQLVFADVYTRDGPAAILGAPMMERALSAPGVTKVAATWAARTVLVWDNAGELVDVRPFVRYATANLFDVLGVPLIAGRLPSDDEGRSGLAFVATRTMARLVAGSETAAVGARVRVKIGRDARQWATIVGVVPDVGGLGGWGAYAPLYALQRPAPTSYTQLIIGVSGSPAVRARELTSWLGRMDSRITTTRVQGARAMMDAARGATRGRNLFLASVAALALVLAAVGVYGITSYSAELRLREFGIRIALGASAARVARALYRDLWWMAPLAIGVGVFAAGRLTAFLDTLYRNPMMRSPLVVLRIEPTLAAGATLVVIAIIGTAIPLRRVLRLDVVRALHGSTDA